MFSTFLMLFLLYFLQKKNAFLEARELDSDGVSSPSVSTGVFTLVVIFLSSIVIRW